MVTQELSQRGDGRKVFRAREGCCGEVVSSGSVVTQEGCCGEVVCEPGVENLDMSETEESWKKQMEEMKQT